MRSLRSSIWISPFISRGSALLLRVAWSSSNAAVTDPVTSTGSSLSEGTPSLDGGADSSASEFLLSDFDLHQSLLREAHAKHGVSLNVPPQLPPPGVPPEVPEPVYCASLAEWLQHTKLLYPPIHGSPPLTSTGTRGIGDILDTSSRTVASPLSPTSSSLPSQQASDSRAPSLQHEFLCHACGTAFPSQVSAEQHVAAAHPRSDPKSTVRPVSKTGGQATPSENLGQFQAEAPPSSATTATATGPPSLAEYRKGVALSLPTDAEIERVLAHVWDRRGAEVGGADFVPAASVVVGIADDRKPLSEMALKALPRATPEGAAPGVKRTAAVPLRHAGGTGASAKQPVVPLKQLSSRFPNPLGESAEAQLMARLQNEPVNPFVPEMRVDNAGVAILPERPGAPSLVRAAKRRFRCQLCDATFRLSDALQDHMVEQHQIDMTPEMLVEVAGGELRRNPYAARGDDDDNSPSAAKEVTDGAEAQSHATQRASSDGSAGGLSSSVSSDDWVPPPPVEEAMVSVHVRACSNATLLGEVVDVQQGFLKALRVTQYVLRVDADDSEDASVSTTTGSTEFVVIRVVGEALKFTTDQVTTGSRILVHGSLRMNRHTDSTSRRIHAYPFVQVAAPLGNVTVLSS